MFRDKYLYKLWNSITLRTDGNILIVRRYKIRNYLYILNYDQPKKIFITELSKLYMNGNV